MTSPRGIVVLGAPRSGTTLFRRLLDAHPNIACPGETCILSATARFLESEVVADGLEFGVLNGLAFAGFDEATVLGRTRDLAFGFLSDYAARAGKPRWAEKTAVDAFHIPEIEALCGDAVQYVCIARHGLDVACSMKEFSDRGFTYLRELHEYIARFPRPLEAFAHAWVAANASILDLKARRPDQVHLLRYEALVSEPRSVLNDVFAFLGETYPEGLLETALEGKNSGLGDWKAGEKSTVDGGSVARWRRLPAGVVSRLAEICNPTLEALGYDGLRTRSGDTQARARRRYELAMAAGASARPNSGGGD